MLRPLIVLSLVAAPLAAQEASLVGTWKVSLTVGSKVENGVRTDITGTGTLKIESTADSMIGILTIDSIPGEPRRPPTRMTAKAGASELVSISEGVIKANGQERAIKGRSSWKLKAAGDALSGTVERSVEGMPMANSGPQPISGTKVM